MGGTTDQFFEATGPNSPPPNDSAGFFTNGTSIYHGANISGIVEGVRGAGTGPGALGVIGHGGPADQHKPGGPGVFGQGGAAANDQNGGSGVMGLAPKGKVVTSDAAGVTGFGDTQWPGVRGVAPGPSAGVYGHGLRSGGVGAGPGVLGISDDGVGVVGNGDIGVSAEGVQLGVSASGDSGPAVSGTSRKSQGGVFTNTEGVKAQLMLVPIPVEDPSSMPNAEAGELLVTIHTSDIPGRPKVSIASLWFCKVGGDSSTAQWTRLA